jgi:hypothetical protein
MPPAELAPLAYATPRGGGSATLSGASPTNEEVAGVIQQGIRELLRSSDDDEQTAGAAGAPSSPHSSGDGGGSPAPPPIEFTPVDLAPSEPSGLVFVGLERCLCASMRRCAGIRAAAVRASTAGPAPLRHVPTPGKGHAGFFFTANGEFVIKEIKERGRELITLARILPQLAGYLGGEAGQRSLLNRICCMFTVLQPAAESGKPPTGIVYVVLQNIFPSSCSDSIVERFDFKGHRA